jgi:hypothetical protein
MNITHEQGRGALTRHRDHFAGGFTNRPLPTHHQLRRLLDMGAPGSVGMPW